MAAIVAVWLCESNRETSRTDHNKAGKFGLIQESIDEVLTQNPKIDGLSRKSSDAPSEIKAVDHWEDTLVLSSRRTEWSPDGNRYQLRRIILYTLMRFPIFFGGKIRASSATNLKEPGMKAVLKKEKPRITLYNIEGSLIGSKKKCGMGG
ncbi:MAG TPA: hypothetical protein DCS60_03495 [Opitutae bacterium]|nr:hypothetical protein [Opitutae bacterium]